MKYYLGLAMACRPSVANASGQISCRKTISRAHHSKSVLCKKNTKNDRVPKRLGKSDLLFTVGLPLLVKYSVSAAHLWPGARVFR